MSGAFKALWATESDSGVNIELTELGDTDLPEGDVTVAVKYSTVNYKDGLAVQGNKSKIMRRLPMAPGIDYAGVVEELGATPRVPEVVFGPGPERGGEGLAVNEELLVTLSPPAAARVPDVQHDADEPAAPLGLEHGPVDRPPGGILGEKSIPVPLGVEAPQAFNGLR